MRLLSGQFSRNWNPQSSSKYFYCLCPLLLLLHPKSQLPLQSPTSGVPTPTAAVPTFDRVTLALTSVTEQFVL